jgi:hypothetical protein
MGRYREQEMMRASRQLIALEPMTSRRDVFPVKPFLGDLRFRAFCRGNKFAFLHLPHPRRLPPFVSLRAIPVDSWE